MHLRLNIFSNGLKLDLALVHEVYLFLKEDGKLIDEALLGLHVVDHLDLLGVSRLLRVE